MDVRIAERGGVKVVGMPIGTDEYAMESAMEIVENGRAGQLARIPPRRSDKHSANLISTGSMGQRTTHDIERGMDPELSPPTCQKADNCAMLMLENLLHLPGTAEESAFFEDGCPTSLLALLPHQRAQVSLSVHGGWRVWAVVG